MSYVLLDRGFIRTSTCKCGGAPKETWTRFGKKNAPSIHVEYRPDRDYFRVHGVYPSIRGTVAEMPAALDKLIRLGSAG